MVELEAVCDEDYMITKVFDRVITKTGYGYEIFETKRSLAMHATTALTLLIHVKVLPCYTCIVNTSFDLLLYPETK